MAEYGSSGPQAQSVTRGEAQFSLEVNIKKPGLFLRRKEAIARIATVVKVTLQCQVTIIVMIWDSD